MGDNIIPFPDPIEQQVFIDEDGVEWSMHSALYEGREGPRISVIFFALDEDDAQEVIETMRNTLEYGGPVFCEIDW